jgi:hypothetical protein
VTASPDLSRLPWELDLTADAPGLDVSWRYDAPRARLHATVRNTGAEAIRPGELRLVASLGFSAAEGWAWLHGRYMQMDALVRRFGAPAEDGYDGRYVHAAGESRTYVSRELCVLTLPSEATPSLLVGSLRMDRFFFDVELEVDQNEEYVEQLRLIWDPRASSSSLAPSSSCPLFSSSMAVTPRPWSNATRMRSRGR